MQAQPCSAGVRRSRAAQPCDSAPPPFPGQRLPEQLRAAGLGAEPRQIAMRCRCDAMMRVHVGFSCACRELSGLLLADSVASYEGEGATSPSPRASLATRSVTNSQPCNEQIQLQVADLLYKHDTVRAAVRQLKSPSKLLEGSRRPRTSSSRRLKNSSAAAAAPQQCTSVHCCTALRR